jgi:thiol-disulfide isomerase/thioredoxin
MCTELFTMMTTTMILFLAITTTQMLTVTVSAFSPSFHTTKRTSSHAIISTRSTHRARSPLEELSTRRRDPTSSSSSLWYKTTDDEEDGNDDKIKEIVERKKRLLSPSRVIRSTPIKNIVSIETLDDFIDYMHNNRDEHQVVVVRFFASWCKTCKRTEPSFYRLVRRNPNIKFVNIPFTQHNSDLHETLNVSAVPYAHIYQSAKLIDEMKLNTTKHWSGFEQSVKKLNTKPPPPAVVVAGKEVSKTS